MENVALKSRSSQAKILGTVVSLSGAFVVTLYKGPRISLTNQTQTLLLNSTPSNSNWVIGGLLLTAEYILVPVWYIVQVNCTQKLFSRIFHQLSGNASFNSEIVIFLQAQIMKEYPNELTVIFFYNVCVSIVAAVAGLITEKNPNAWRLRPNMALVSIVCSVRT